MVVSNKKKEFTWDDVDHDFDIYQADKDMFDEILTSEDLQADQWKIYPCEVIPWTRIEVDYENGIYQPYAEFVDHKQLDYDTIKNSKLFQLILDVKKRVHPWIRLNRVIRDIPGDIVVAGNNYTNMRQLLIQTLEKEGKYCKCIRCREIKRLNVI